MPTGTAHIIADRGEIVTDPPSPVAFIRSKFPDIVDQEQVYFERQDVDPNMAKLVISATSADMLVHLATPPNGLTRPAQRFLLAHASKLLTPCGDGAADAIAFETARVDMSRLATRLAAHPGRVGIAVLRIRLSD